MSRHDWYRQTVWSPTQETSFFQRLARSRSPFHRAQYLRIQALTLAQTGQPSNLRVALGLLERIFADYPDAFDVAMAYLQAARCHDALGNIEAASQHFEQALAEQSKSPNYQTGVTLEFPWFIVRHGMVELYDRALEVLVNVDSVFPIQRFKECTCRALIADHRGERVAAEASAQAALQAAGLRRSPFARHPSVGLVGDEHSEWIERLEALAST
jgi:tetratricopeptide (TPR) repeat protein